MAVAKRMKDFNVEVDSILVCRTGNLMTILLKPLVEALFFVEAPFSGNGVCCPRVEFRNIQKGIPTMPRLSSNLTLT